jgi:hypothetical protein
MLRPMGRYVISAAQTWFGRQLSQQVVFPARKRGDGDAIYASTALVLRDVIPGSARVAGS